MPNGFEICMSEGHGAPVVVGLCSPVISIVADGPMSIAIRERRL
jgi:hypothetical protein